MADNFDPYYKWLGIPPKDQPPNHYRLLGIDLYEADAEVIDAAANRQMAYIQSCADGPHLASSQQLLNQVSAARVCLLDQRRKASYDAQLKQKLGSPLADDSAEEEPPSPPPRNAVAAPPKAEGQGMAPTISHPEFVVVADAASESSDDSGEIPIRPNRQAKQMLWIAGGTGLLAMGAIALMLSFTGQSGEHNDQSDASQRRRNRPIAKAKGVSNGELEGIIIDDAKAFVLNWRPQQAPGTKFIGQGYLVDDSSGSGNSVAEFAIPDDIDPGYYEVRISYVPGAGRATNVKVRVYHSGKEQGPAERMVNQRRTPEHDELFHTPGIFQFSGKSREKVEINNKGANGAVVVDAIQLISVAESASELSELFKFALAAIEKKDVKEAKRLLEKYLEDPDAPKLIEARGLLDALFNHTSDKFALTQLARMNERQLEMVANATWPIPESIPPGLGRILLDTLQKNLPEARRQRARRKTPKDKPPKKTKPPKTEPKPKDKQPFNPNTHPKEFLQSHGLIQKGAFWILEEGPLAKRVSSLAKLEKTYRAASNTLAVSLKNLNKIRTQLKAYLREAQRLEGLGRLPPPEIMQFINQWNPKVGSDRAIAANVDFRNLILAKIKSRDELTIPFLKLKKEIVSREEAYQRFGADLQVGEALSKLAGNIRHRLGPSSGFKPTLAKFKKYEAMLMTDEVPFYLQGRDTFISAVLNENMPLVFSNNPSMDSNLIPAAVLKKAGIVVDPAAVRVTLSITFAGKQKRTFACREISISAIRFGRHVLKDLKFLVTPPEAMDLGAVLGGNAFDGYRVEADRDKFVFKIRPRDEAVKGKKKP